VRGEKGFTLIELIITLALLSLVIVGATQLLVFGIRGHQSSISEFDVQSNLRIVSQRVNTIIRDSAAVFLLHRDNANNLTDEWNYIMLSPEKDRLIHYAWNDTTNTHDLEVMFPSIDGVELDFILNKNEDLNSERLLRYQLTVTVAGAERTINTELESKNSLQVVDRSYLLQANTLAYRTDTRLDEVSNSQAVVAMVLDKSGSMSRAMDGGGTSLSKPSRISLLKQEAIRLVEGLAELPNVYVSINPFDSTANGSYAMMNAKQEIDTSPGLRSIINGLTAGGGTNTGDGIRRAYYRIDDFNENNTDKTNKNFMIILVDGVTTFGSVHEIVTDHTISFSSYQGTNITVAGRPYTFSHSTGFFWWRTYYYDYVGELIENYVTGDGDIQNLEAQNNNYYAEGRYYGDGSNLDRYGTAYVDLMGEMVQSYKEGTNEEIKVYVIGFSAVTTDYGSLRDIALATTGDTVYYEAGSSEALQEIFNSIQRDISDALWHIGGPN